MTRLAAFVASLLLVCGASLPAAQKPSFAGTWIIQPPNKAAGTERTIKQDDKTLTITTLSKTATYQLDGVDHRDTKQMRDGQAVIFTRAAWEKNTVVISFVTLYPSGMKTFERETWSIDAKGQLVIELAETAQGQPVSSMKIVHKKKN